MVSGPRIALAGVVLAVVGAGVVLGTGLVSLDGDGRSTLSELAGPGNPLATDGAGEAAPEPPVGTPTATTVTSERITGTPSGEPETASGGETPTAGPTPTDASTDTDGDGLSDRTEGNGLTDPTDPDTDGDGLGDSQEVAGDTSPVVTDTDSDGVPDGREFESDTDPARADTDGDELGDARELNGPTDATDADTDDDQLLDGWEVRERGPDGVGLPNASATRMDLYVQLLYGQFARPFSERERNLIEGEFAEMAVPNPDGSRGIAAHFRDERPDSLLNESVRVTGRDESFAGLKATYETAAHMGARRGVYHLVVVGQVRAKNRTGFGEAPGLVSVVDERGADVRAGDTTARGWVVVHELLHNVVGAFTVGTNADERYHLLNETRFNTTNFAFSAESYYRLYGSYLVGPPRPIPYRGEWNISGVTRREIATRGFQAPAGEGFPPTNGTARGVVANTARPARRGAGRGLGRATHSRTLRSAAGRADPVGPVADV